MSQEFAGVNPDLFTDMTGADIEIPEWFLEVDGQNVPFNSCVRLYSPKVGRETRLGRRKDGFVGPLDHETGGGGSVVMPFTYFGNNLFVGLAEQIRPNMGGVVLNAIGGMVDPGETHLEAASREFAEEVGKFSKRFHTYVDLNEYSHPGNFNRLFTDTSRKNEGVHFYAVEFHPKELEAAGYYEWPTHVSIPVYKFKPGVLVPNGKNNKVAEKILSSKFYHWVVAAVAADFCANGALTRLEAYLYRGNMSGKII